MTQTVTAPAVIKIVNTSDKTKTFVPYKENFVTNIAAGGVLELKVKTSGQVLYYLDQATNGLTITNIADFDSAAGAIKIGYPETVTLTNNGAKVVNFIPYRENFDYSVAAGDAVVITADTVGQVLYYLAQATDDLVVTHSVVE